jgi:hypothetical protein
MPPVRTSIVITATTIESTVDRRDSAVFSETLFGRDDQILHVLGAGISAGQHEGGGKSLEISPVRFQPRLWWLNGGLKAARRYRAAEPDDAGTWPRLPRHLKSISPELVQEVNLINGPFSPEYGDFSGLGVVHIRSRDSMPDKITTRMRGGSFNSSRGFLALSPDVKEADALVAYEGSATDGPFVTPLGYRRDNVSASFLKRLSSRTTFGTKLNGGRNDFTSSGQQGLRVRNATLASYWRREGTKGDVLKVDRFITRSLFDLFSNFTYSLNDPERGDAIQQHDSRLVEGGNAQYQRPHRMGGVQAMFTAGGNYHDNQLLVGLDSRVGRMPVDVITRANARVTNGAGYVQESVNLFGDRLQLGGGLRYDAFRFGNRNDGAHSAARWQPKASLAYTPTHRVPLTYMPTTAAASRPRTRV